MSGQLGSVYLHARIQGFGQLVFHFVCSQQSDITHTHTSLKCLQLEIIQLHLEDQNNMNNAKVCLLHLSTQSLVDNTHAHLKSECCI